MKFPVDQDVYAITIKFLKDLDHDVVSAAQLGMCRARDFQLLQCAHGQGRILITWDRDFGALVFVQASGPGVIYLRILPSMIQHMHTELARVLSLYIEPRLQSSFVVIEPGKHRIRKV